MTGWEVPGPMLVTATPGTDATVWARVPARCRCSFSCAKTAEGRIVSFAAVGLSTAVTTTSGRGMAATSRSTVAVSPGRTSTEPAAYPRRSTRSRYDSASGTAIRNDPSPCVVAVPPVLTTSTIAPARGIPLSADRTVPVTWSMVSAACCSTGVEPADGVGTPARISPRRKKGTGKRLGMVMEMPGDDMIVSCWVRRQGRSRGQVSGRPGIGLGDFSLQRDGEGGSAALVRREVERRGGRRVSRDRRSPKQIRAGETRRMRPGRVAGRLPHVAYGTLRSRLGFVLMRVGGLGDGDDQEREGDGDTGERAHASPEPHWINAVNHP